MNIDGILVELSARGVESDDLSEMIHELTMESFMAGMDRSLPETEQDALIAGQAGQAETLNSKGLRAQIEYLASYFGNMRDLRMSLCNFLTLPEVCHA